MVFTLILQWATPFTIHTPPVEDLLQTFHTGSINLKWISHYTHTLWKTYCKHFKQGVSLSSGLATTHTPCGRLIANISHREYQSQVD